MSSQRRMGIYWGNNGIDLVEINKDAPVSTAFVSFADLERNPVLGIKHLTEDLRLLDLLQKTLRSGSFSTGNAFLSLPSKDIIIRAFQIPWMKPDEIQGAVAFEAKKYVPFPLEELIYTYYPTTVTKGNSRQIGILLTAIRKIDAERYTNVLVQAGISVVYSEPAAVSLLRALVYRKLIDLDKISVVLSGGEEAGEIIIAFKGQAQFLRDFNFHGAPPPQSEDVAEFTRNRFFNEIRMSLEFFSRQNAGPEVERIVAVSSGLNADAFAALAEETGLSLQRVDPYSVFDQAGGTPAIGHMRAFGVALLGSVPAVPDCNLSEGQLKTEAAVLPKKPLFTIPPKFFLVVGALAVCAGAVAGSLWWTDGLIRYKTSAKNDVLLRLGKAADTPREVVDMNLALISKKTSTIKTLAFKSALSPLVVRLIQLMPDGFWLDTLDVTSKDDPVAARPQAVEKKTSGRKKPLESDYYELKTTVTLQLTGYASLNDTNAEFELVNQFVETLNKDPQISKVFADIKVSTLEARPYQQRGNAVYFVIDFK